MANTRATSIKATMISTREKPWWPSFLKE